MEILANNRWGVILLFSLLIIDLISNVHSTYNAMSLEDRYNDEIEYSYKKDTVIESLKTEICNLKKIQERDQKIDSLKKDANIMYSIIDSLITKDSFYRTEEEKDSLISVSISKLKPYKND